MIAGSGRSGAFEPGGPVPCFRPMRGPGFNTTRPFPAAGPVGRMARCEKEPAVILVLDQAQADLGGSELRCPDCPGQLRRWGFARTRSLRCSGGGRVSLRPRRVRCADCRVTHVLLPAIAPAGSALADALSALATAAAATVRRLGPLAPPWQIIAMIARGRLLAPVRSG